MPEYSANAVQTVAAGSPVVFTETAIPCTKGYVIHRQGSGLFTLRGVTQNCFARYRVTIGGNIAIPTGGTVGEISVAIAINGEPIPVDTARVTPAAVAEYWNVSRSTNIDVPRGCCYTVAIQNTSTQPIDIQNANIIIERIA